MRELKTFSDLKKKKIPLCLYWRATLPQYYDSILKIFCFSLRSDIYLLILKNIHCVNLKDYSFKNVIQIKQDTKYAVLFLKNWVNRNQTSKCQNPIPNESVKTQHQTKVPKPIQTRPESIRTQDKTSPKKTIMNPTRVR